MTTRGPFSAGGVVEVGDLEAGALDLLNAELQRLDVGVDDLLVVVATAGEALADEVLEVLGGHPAERGDRADHDHVGRARVAGGARQLVDGDADGAAVGLEVDVLGVVDQHAAVTQFGDVALVGLAVEHHEDVEGVAVMLDRIGGDAGLRPGGAALDLRGIGRIGLHVVADAAGCLREPLGCRDLSLATFTCEPDDQVCTHLSSSRRRVWATSEPFGRGARGADRARGYTDRQCRSDVRLVRGVWPVIRSAVIVAPGLAIILGRFPLHRTRCFQIRSIVPAYGYVQPSGPLAPPPLAQFA